MACLHEDETSNLFCALCGKVKSPEDLRSVRIAGAIGVRNSGSEAIRRFWATGDPSHFDNPAINQRPGRS